MSKEMHGERRRGWLRLKAGATPAVLCLAALTLALCAAGSWIASSAPDGLEKVAETLGFAGRARSSGPGLLAGYQAPGPASTAARRIAAALAGAIVCFLVVFAMARLFWRRRGRLPLHPRQTGRERVAPGPARPLA